MRLLMLGLRKSEDILGVLQDGVLEPGGGAEKRRARDARLADRPYRPVGVSVRHPRNAPQSVEPRQRLDVARGVRRNPDNFHSVRSRLKRPRNGLMSAMALVKISDEPDPNL